MQMLETVNAVAGLAAAIGVGIAGFQLWLAKN